MSILYCPTTQSEDFFSIVPLVDVKVTSTDKAMILYKILQAGGVAENTWIASDDKDFEPVWAALCKLATSKIMKFHV